MNKRQRTLAKHQSGNQKKTRPNKVKKQRTKRRKQIQKKKRKRINQQKRQQLLKQLGLSLCITVIVLAAISYLTFSVPKVEGYSMSPTITNDERVFVNKIDKIKRFDLIYFKEPKKHHKMIQRVIGLPNETLFYQQGQLFIDGKEISERFLDDQTMTSEAKKDTNVTADFSLHEVTGITRIPVGYYFVLGDSRLYATDSRSFGLVKQKDVIGVVTMRVFPFYDMTHF